MTRLQNPFAALLQKPLTPDDLANVPTEEDENTILGRIMGGLEVAGNVLGTPQAMLWHAAAGRNPLEVANPFDREAVNKRLTGWDLAEAAGIQNEPGIDWGDVPAVASQVLLDPLLLLRGPGAAVTAAGKAVSKAPKFGGDIAAGVAHMKQAKEGLGTAGRILGKGAAATSEEIGQGLRTLGAVKIPFGPTLANFNLGMQPETAAKAYGALHYGKYSPIPWFRGLFSSRVGGLYPEAIGKTSEKALGALPQYQRDLAYSRLVNLQAAASDVAPVFSDNMGQLQGMFDSLGSYAKSLGGTELATLDDTLRYAGEIRDTLEVGTKAGETRLPAMGSETLAGMFPDAAEALPFADKATSMADAMKQINDVFYDPIRKLGGSGELLGDYFSEHMARHVSPDVLTRGTATEVPGKRLLNRFGTPEALHREAILKAPGGTAVLNAMSRDELLVGTDDLAKGLAVEGRTIATTADLEAALVQELNAMGPEALVGLPKNPKLPDLQEAYARAKYLEPEFQRLAAEGRIAGDSADAYGAYFNAQDKKPPLVRGLTEFLARQPDAVRDTGIYGRGVLKDWMDYNEHAAGALANLLSAHTMLKNVAVPASKMAAMSDDEIRATGKIPLGEAWSNATVMRGGKAVPALKQEGLITFMRNYLPDAADANPEVLKAAANTVWVDSRVPDVLARYIDVNSPEAKSSLGRVYDWATSLFKTGVTIPFPAFHMRNFVDGTWRNLMRAGSETYSPAKYWSALTDAGSVAFRPKGFTQEAISKLKYGKEFLTGHTGWGSALEELGDLGTAAKNITAAPTLKEKLFGAAASEAGIGAKAKGLGSKLLGLAGGIHERVEFVNRYSAFAAAMESGKTASQAADLAREIQYVYGKAGGANMGALPGSLASRMPRVVPFWNFASQNIPYQLAQLINMPGGGTAQTLKLMGMNRGESGYVPGWMREQTGVRTGGPDEAANFIRSFGLSLEQIGLPRFENGNPFNLRSLERISAETNPMIQLWPRLIAQKDLYSGRSVKEMKGVTGVPLIDQLLQVTPVSRAAGTVASLADERKTPFQKLVNVGTGIKWGTYDLGQQKAIELENELKQRIADNPLIRQYSRPYVPEAQKPLVDPDTARELALLEGIAERRRRLLEQTKKAGGRLGSNRE